MSDTVTPELLTVDILTARLTALRDVAIEIRNEAGWCSDWMPRFERMSRAYTRNRNESTFNVDGNRVLTVPVFTSEHLTEVGQAHYAAFVSEACQAELNRIGEYVRYHGQAGTITVDQANKALTTLGLPEVARGTHNRYMNMPYVRYVGSTERQTSGQQDAMRNAVKAAFAAWLTTLNSIDGIESAEIYGGNDYIDFNGLRPETHWGVTSEPTGRR